MSKLDFSSLDIPAEVERHTSTRLHPTSRSGKQYSGACPYDDCSVDENGFTVWAELTPRGRHYYCRGCRRSGDIVKLLQDIQGWTFKQACAALEIANPYTPGAPAPATTQPRRARGAIAATDEQLRERDFLQLLYPQARRALKQPRARAYLAQRGIPFDLAQDLGLAYIPPISTLDVAKLAQRDLDTLKRWQDRILFPLTSAAGPGFTGRTLAYWQEGMDENEHKKLLDEHKVPRYMSTYPAGYFHADVLTSSEDATFTEGPFDALAMLAAGMTNAVATCGTSLDALAIPLHLKRATLAYDGDESGRKAAEALRKLLRREVGILDPRICTPPDDEQGKDWSERYRLHGREGLARLLDGDPMPEVDKSHAPPLALDSCHQCGASTWVITDENKAYCKACWRALGNEPAPGEGCCLCGDFMDRLDEELLDQIGELRYYCDACWSKRDNQVDHDSPLPFTSYEHFVATVEAMAARLTQNTGVPWSVTPLPPGQTIDDYRAQQAEAEQIAAAEERQRLRMARLERTRTRAS